MRKHIEQFAEALDSNGCSYSTILASIDVLLKVNYNEIIENSRYEFQNAIWRLVKETSYLESPKKFLCYIYLLKHAFIRENISLDEFISESFFVNIDKIEVDLIRIQIYELTYCMVSQNLNDLGLIMAIWKDMIINISICSDKSKSFTELVLYIYRQFTRELASDISLNKIHDQIMDIFSDIYSDHKFLFTNDTFISKLEFAQNSTFPFILSPGQSNEQLKMRFIEKVIGLFEGNINLKAFVFTFCIPNLVKVFIENGYFFDKDEIITYLYQGITSSESRIRKSTRFILEEIEKYSFEKYADNGSYEKQFSENMTSFLCILNCFENFSIHLLKSNWAKFENLLFNLQFSKREWWVDCLLKIGFTHDNLNVQRFVAFNTMKFTTKENGKSLPSWMKHEIFFNICLKYITSSLNNKISLQIEELFVQFIYCVLINRTEWICDYLKLINNQIKAFTSIRILIYPFSIGIKRNLNHSSIIEQMEPMKFNLNMKSNFNHTIITKSGMDITNKYSFESNIEYYNVITIPRELFNTALEVSIPIIKYVPIVLRFELYILWAEIITHFLIYSNFSKEEILINTIYFLGMIPEYIYSTRKFQTIIESFIDRNEYNFDSNFTLDNVVDIPKKWFNVLHYGYGFGRLKKFLKSSSDQDLLLSNKIVFVSSFYNSELFDFSNTNFNSKIVEITNSIALLFESVEQNDSIDLDMLWLDIHLLSLKQAGSYNKHIEKLWEWCIFKLGCLNTLLDRMNNSINSLISFVMILKCLIFLQKYKREYPGKILFKIINNLLIIENHLFTKLPMNNSVNSWEENRRSCFLYEIFDSSSINDKYCIIQSSELSIGFPESYQCSIKDDLKMNRLIKLFPVKYRDLINIFSQLRFQLVYLLIVKNHVILTENIECEISYFKIINGSLSSNNIITINGSCIKWFEHIIIILLNEINNSGMNDIYLWLLMEQVLHLILLNNYEIFGNQFVNSILNEIYIQIKRVSDEILDNGIYKNYLFTIFHRILTEKRFFSLFQDNGLLQNMIQYYYENILSNHGSIRLFIFPLLNLISHFINSCSNILFQELLDIKNTGYTSKFEEFQIINLIANVIVELITFEEQGLMDGSKIRFQKSGSFVSAETFDLYERCKIYEDYNGFIRYTTVVYLYNLIEHQNNVKNENFENFVLIIVVLLTKRLNGAIPTFVKEKVTVTRTPKNDLDHCKYRHIFIMNQAECNSCKKFPPLPNSNAHKVLINLWQSLCCLINSHNFGNDLFINYLLEFFFQHLNYLYTPDIRQYIDLFGCNIVAYYPKKCIGYITEWLQNNHDNYTQLIYSFLCISSFLISFLKDINPLPYNKELFINNHLIEDLFEFESEVWIKVDRDFLNEYSLFFNTFISYSVSNSSLLRNIVIYTIKEIFNEDLIVKSSFSNSIMLCLSKDEIHNFLDSAFLIQDFKQVIDFIRNSKFNSKNEDISYKIFFVNYLILEESMTIRNIVYHIYNDEEILKMTKNLSFVWNIWKPLKHISIEYIIPQCNLIEFFDQKASQDYFGFSQCFDIMLRRIDESSQMNIYDMDSELLAFQDKYETYILNSHLVFGNLRPSWSMYYLMKKIVSREMSDYYYECTNEPEKTEKTEIQTSYNYQLKFEPSGNNSNTCEGRSRTLENPALNRTNLIVIGSLVEKIPNIAGLTRTCEIFRAEELLLSSKKVLNDPIFRRISVTAEKWLPISELKPCDIREFIYNKRLEGYKVFGLEQTSSSSPLSGCKFPKKSILVLGREKEGIPPELISIMDQCIEIPQYGIIRSLNVHVSASIFIYEYTSQFMRDQTR
ncbi:tRNA (Gm18) ribose methylase [Cryptosporidium felis]|nr:tRNA (Gm18) ribose methylase [Cryptosporidium felis]